MMKLWLVTLLCSICFSGCLYHCDIGTKEPISLSIPFIEGDLSGCFTKELIYAVSTQGSFRYAPSQAQYILKVCLLPPCEENIGFNFPSKKGEKKRILASQEASLQIFADVTLIECASNEVIQGPTRLFARLDFDFESDFSHFGNNEFSLAQLQMHNLAREGAVERLASLLAQRVVDFLIFTTFSNK